MESIYQSEASDYNDFDLLVQKIKLDVPSKRLPEEDQNVRASMESIKSDFNFDLVP